MKQKPSHQLVELFDERFGGKPVLYVISPGRSEIAGNHTDHEGGQVIAAAIDRAVHGLARPCEEHVVYLHSAGFCDIAVSLDTLEPQEDEKGTTDALVRGMAALFVERGFEPHGFELACISDVMGGSGLSSSAAFELMLAQVMNALWAEGSLSPEVLAFMSQRCEREWFGKPCGLMDQAAVALGGIQHMDFHNPTELVSETIDFDFASAGYAICIVSVGEDHAANIDDYAAVPAEMQAVAEELGEEVLSNVTWPEFLKALPRLRKRQGDRAALRALHYFQEDWLVSARAEALKNDDIDYFLELTRHSGASSAMYLQNVSIGGSDNQPGMLAIGLGESLLGGHGAVRVHGGGFGGTIQAFVPLDMVDEFSDGMDAVFGDGACGVYDVDPEGARFTWLKK